jgi:type I restriction enzyme S subunit
MPKNWKIYKLEELTTKLGDGLHGTPKYSLDGEYYFINGNNLTNGKIEIKENTKRVDKAQYLKYQKPLNDRTIFVSINGTLGNVATYNNEKVVLGKSACYFNINDNVDKVFIKQFVSSPDFKYFLECNATGSVIKNISLKSMREYEIQLPPLPEQTQIANILSAIDDKIENNLAINKTLEDMAMALYKHWFVDFGPFQEGEFVDSELGLIPKGWEMKRLDEVAYKNSKTFDFKGKQEVVFVNTGDVQNGSFLHKNYSETEGLPGQAKKVIEPNDILYSEIRPKNKRYAYVDFDSSDYVVSTKFMIIRNNEKINNRLLYRILTRQDSIDEFQMIAESRSGTFPQITFDVIGHFPIVLPNLEIQNKFQSIVDPFEKQQSNNLMEIKSLTKLRDTLLPKLISGEVRLKEFREEIDAEINSA